MNNLWVSVSGAISQQKNVETIANNVANANTPGFKRDQLSFKEHLTALTKNIDDVDLPRKEWKPEDFYRSYGAENSFVKVSGSYTNFEQGQLSPTGNPLDLAIKGTGFFEVLTPNGIRYTRRGTFTLANDGTLVNDKGYPILSSFNKEQLKAKNAEIPEATQRTIKIPDGKLDVNMRGEIFSSGNKIADLSLLEFKDIKALKKEGGLMFINQDRDNIVLSTAKSQIHQGFVESSNVNAVSEMAKLIKAHRHFQTIQKVIKTYDQITGKGVNEISKF
ncbi:MAG: flagellar basal-body rod protein FlgF [Bacteriovoracaceae bacterium]|nr:flagellar basal-body rod protein FlgF [Bacteriovoracaceae bacterium]